MGSGARLSRRGGPPGSGSLAPDRACSHCLLADALGLSAIPSQPHAPHGPTRAQGDDPSRPAGHIYDLAVENRAGG
jgi:hypothetical protein